MWIMIYTDGRALDLAQRDVLWKHLYFKRWPDPMTDDLTEEELLEATAR